MKVNVVPDYRGALNTSVLLHASGIHIRLMAHDAITSPKGEIA